MAEITRQMLRDYLHDALPDPELAAVEKALRESAKLRSLYKEVVEQEDRGEHTVGAIWRRERISCVSRDQLGSYLLQVLEEAEQDYIAFHLATVGCPFCQANLADIEALRQEPVAKAKERRQRFFKSSADYLQVAKEA